MYSGPFVLELSDGTTLTVLSYFDSHIDAPPYEVVFSLRKTNDAFREMECVIWLQETIVVRSSGCSFPVQWENWFVFNSGGESVATEEFIGILQDAVKHPNRKVVCSHCGTINQINQIH